MGGVIFFIHCVIWRVDWQRHVFVHIKNENKTFPVFASFCGSVDLDLVAKLSVQRGWDKEVADREGYIWQPRDGLRDVKLALKSTKGNEGGCCGACHQVWGVVHQLRVNTLKKRSLESLLLLCLTIGQINQSFALGMMKTVLNILTVILQKRLFFFFCQLPQL